jgi:hypothetical protein
VRRCYGHTPRTWFPGLLQTAGYTEAGLIAVRDRLSLPADDIAEAVAERMDRQSVLRSGRRRFVFVIEEQALTQYTVPRAVLAGQLRHLESVMGLPSVSVGIVPASARRPGLWQPEAFYMFDDEMVAVELISGLLEVRQPGEVALYAQVFNTLAAHAAYGAAARALIAAALEAPGS